MKFFVGNDLIDFNAEHNRGRGAQPRFLERIFSAAERAYLAAQASGDFGFAQLWSAKEAAYKAAKKQQPQLVFAPRRWLVSIQSQLPDTGDSHGSVQIDEDTRVVVHWQASTHWLHCLGVLGTPSALIEHAVEPFVDGAADTDFSERERSGFSRRESAAVRGLAKRLLQRHGIRDVEILRNTEDGVRLPPRVFANGQVLTDLDLSLSHDGAYVAAVVAIGQGDEQQR